MSTGPSIDTSFALEKFYPAGKNPSPNALAEHPQAAGEIAEQMSQLSWQKVKNEDGRPEFELHTQDVVYLSSISPPLSKEEVRSPDAPRPANFWEKIIRDLKDRLAQRYGDVFSHNYFVAELAKLEVGIIRFQLALLGVSSEEINRILAEAKQEKSAAVDTGIRQLASEKVLFAIVTGARV
jgi:hypothetical protein